MLMYERTSKDRKKDLCLSLVLYSTPNYLKRSLETICAAAEPLSFAFVNILPSCKQKDIGI